MVLLSLSCGWLASKVWRMIGDKYDLKSDGLYLRCEEKLRLVDGMVIVAEEEKMQSGIGKDKTETADFLNLKVKLYRGGRTTR
jgi:hypothetical protein